MGAMDKRLINGEVEPAKNFYTMLCKDKKFKQDYLVHRDCFRYIEKVSIVVHQNPFKTFNNIHHAAVYILF